MFGSFEMGYYNIKFHYQILSHVREVDHSNSICEIYFDLRV